MFNCSQLEIINGLLLSDGCIPIVDRGNNHFSFSQKSDKEEYVRFIAAELNLSQERVKTRDRNPDKRTGKIYSCSELRTLSSPAFTLLRNKWYPLGIKGVPRDIIPSPNMFLHWFLGDGSCSINRNSLQMVLCTDSFSNNDVLFLNNLLASIGVEGRVLGNNRIRISNKSIKSLYDYIGSSPVHCYEYKWR